MKLKLPKSSLGRKMIFLSLPIVILVAWFFIKQLQGPVEGAIFTSSTNPTPQVKMSRFDGRAVMFDYQSDFTQVDSSQSQPNVSEYYVFNKPARANSPAAYLAITIYDIPSGKAEDNSAYDLRRAHPETYSSRTFEINGSNFTIFTENDAREVIAFSVKGKRLGTISLIATLATPSQLRGQFDTVLNSWQWK